MKLFIFVCWVVLMCLIQSIQAGVLNNNLKDIAQKHGKPLMSIKKGVAFLRKDGIGFYIERDISGKTDLVVFYGDALSKEKAYDILKENYGNDWVIVSKEANRTVLLSEDKKVVGIYSKSKKNLAVVRVDKLAKMSLTDKNKAIRDIVIPDFR